MASGINAVDLKHRLGNIEADCRDRRMFGSSKLWGLKSAHIHGPHVPAEEPFTPTIAEIAPQANLGCFDASKRCGIL